MENLIDIRSYPVSMVLKELLLDRTTGENIIFATNIYSENGNKISEKTQMTVDKLMGFDSTVIQPRVLKTMQEQSERTRKKAEVFTPAWICNKMNNHCDYEWFGREGVFNNECEQSWIPTLEKIDFDDSEGWKKYVDSKRLEITCGEAPYIVSRYDAASGELIPIKERIGILDRKLRVVNENAANRKEWNEWVHRAYQSVYGYEFQGDNLLIARINLLITFVDYVVDRWGKTPPATELSRITDIITWNFWQMDGITGTVPYGKPQEEYQQLSFFDFTQGINDTEPEKVDCYIYDWRNDEKIAYRSIKEKKL